MHHATCRSHRLRGSECYKQELPNTAVRATQQATAHRSSSQSLRRHRLSAGCMRTPQPPGPWSVRLWRSRRVACTARRTATCCRRRCALRSSSRAAACSSCACSRHQAAGCLTKPLATAIGKRSYVDPEQSWHDDTLSATMCCLVGQSPPAACSKVHNRHTSIFPTVSAN